MKFEIEILDRDLEDRQILSEMREFFDASIKKLSQYFVNEAQTDLENVKAKLEWVENEWLFIQRDRAINKMSEFLNVESKRLSAKEYEYD